MVDTSQLTELISALRAETEANSVSPERVGYVLQQIVDFLPTLDSSGLTNDVATALSTARQALSTAQGATTTANAAQTAATSAQNVANSASATATQAKALADAATDAVSALTALVGQLQTASETATSTAQAASAAVAALREGANQPGGMIVLNSNGKVPNGLLPDELNDTLEFSGIIASATVASGTSEKKSNDSDAQVFYVTALKQFVLGVRTDVQYSALFAAAAPLQSPALQSAEVTTRLTDAQIKEAIALADFPTLYTFYLDWADRELYSNDQYTPHSGKTFICTSTDTSYYWKSSVPALQPMGKDFTSDIAAVQNNVNTLRTTVNAQGNSITALQDIATIMIDLWGNGVPSAETWALNRIYYDATNKDLYKGASNETWTDISTVLNSGRIFVDKSNNISYRWDGSDMVAISTKDVPAAIYNPTVLDPLSDKGLDGFYELVNQNETGRSAVHSAWNNGKAVAGLIISFKISSTVWKTYQYIGTTISSEAWHDATNWQDFGSLAKGSEGYISINATLKTAAAYNIGSALDALRDYESANKLSYAKLGMVISYITSAVDNTVEAKIYAGKSLSDFYEPGLWTDFGGGSVRTSDTPTEDGTDAFSTGGAYERIPATIAKTSTEQEELAGTIKLQLRNAGGSGIGGEVTFNVGTGSGGDGTSHSFNITFQEGTRVAGNVGSSVTLHGCIRSVTYDGSSITPRGIGAVNIYNANTNTLLKSFDFDGQTSSADSSTYDFPMDISDLFKTAGRTYLKIVATDMSGDTATTYFNAVCVDVSILAVNSLTHLGSSVRVGGGEQNLDSFYKFPVNSSGSITAHAEIYVNGSWIPLGTSEVRTTYTQSLSLNPDNIDGNGMALTHGAYPLRLHGVDNSGVVGNYLHTAVMVIDDDDPTPIIVSRWYTDSASGTIRCFDNIEIEYASYSGTTNPLSIGIYENNVLMTTVNSYRTASGTYKHQVTSASGSIAVSFRCGNVQSQLAEWTISGSVINAALTDGAIFSFDFSNRSNSDADKSIVSGNYAMTVTGANYDSNGFGRFLGENCLAVKDKMQVSLNCFPFSSNSGIATSGFAMLLKFASQYAIDDNAKLLSCFSADANGNPTGAGFYITGNKVGIYSNLGEPQIAERRYPAGKKVTVGITIDPSAVYISNGGVQYSMMRLYLDGDLVGCVGYPTANASGALIQESNISMDGTNASFYPYYMIGWRKYPVYREMFNNYLVKLTEATDMVTEYNFENVFTDGTDRPVADELYTRGMPYVIEAPLGTYNGDAGSQDMTAPDKTTSTKAKTYIDLFYYNPDMPWRNFVAVNVQRRNQGTTSTKRPVKNSRYYLGAGKGSSSYGDGKTHLYSIATPDVIARLTPAQRADYELWLKLLKANKVRVGANTIPVDIITVKVDYSDSTNANDCGVCNMMNATFRALGPEYLTPAQRYFDGTYTFTYRDDENVEHTETITGLELNHSTANHPVAVFRSLSGGTTSLTMYAKGNWKEDKNESKALGFYGTPGYNAGCHSYQESDFVEWVAPSSVTAIGDASTPGTAVYMFLNSFASGHAWDESTEKNPDKLYLVTLYCGSSYRFMRFNSQTNSWYDSTGNYSQDSDGTWQISEGANHGTDVLNPVDGYELREYASLCWFRDVANVNDMMQLVTGSDGTTQQPKWLNYFESMIDCDELTALYQKGYKVPYWLYRFLLFCNSVSDTEDGSANAATQRLLWRNNAYKYMKVKPVMAYDATCDYNALVDQESKNMQPMFFLEDGGCVTGGDYDDETKMLMYPNKVYDADGANGKDNETVASVDPEVDPNKPDDATTGYTNPYAGKNSVLWRNLYHQPEVVYNAAGSTVTMRNVVAAMRSLNLRVDDGFTGSPFSPEGAKHFFIDQICKRWQKTVSGYDGENKFITAKELDADGNETGTLYFKSVYGLRLTELDEYISTRWRQRDGFYGCGAFTASYLNFRTGAGIASGAGITIKAAKSGYFGVGYQTPGSVSESVYLEAGESHRFTGFSHEDNSDTYIYQPDRILELDLSEIVVTNTASFASCTLLKKLFFGGASHSETITGANAFINTLALGDLPFLELLDIRNTHVTNVNASGCPRLEQFFATGTSLATLTLAQTSPIASLSLPATITALQFINLPNLTYTGGLTLAGMTAIITIHIEGSTGINADTLIKDVLTAQSGHYVLNQLRVAQTMKGDGTALSAIVVSGAHGIDSTGQAITMPAIEATYELTKLYESTDIAAWEAAIYGLTVVTVIDAYITLINEIQDGEDYGGDSEVPTITLANVDEYALTYYNGEEYDDYLSDYATANADINDIVTS